MRWIPGFMEIDRFVLEVSLKAAAVLAAAWAMEGILRMRRSSPAARHAVWSLATGGVLALPLLTAALPQWSVALPGGPEAPIVQQDAADPQPSLAWPSLTQAEVAAAPAGVAIAGGSPSAVPAGVSAGAGPAPSESEPRGSATAWLLPLWLVGACLVLAPAVLGGLSLWRLGRSSRRVTAGPLRAALDRALDRLRMKRSIRLLESDRRFMPMTWGLWRPTVLLPEQAQGWEDARLETVLLHELAHVRRGDCLLQLLAQLARAVYWLNPLSWLAVRRLRALHEQACDDLVLSAGCEAPDYAEHLLAVSAECRSHAWAAGLAMARTPKLERRLRSILNPLRDRRPLTRRRLALAALAGAALLAPLSVLSFDPAAGAEPPIRRLAGEAPLAEPQGDLNAALDELRARIAGEYVTPVDDREIVRSAIRGMLQALHDPYSDYLTPEMLADMEIQTGGTLAGVGVQLEEREGAVRVVTPLLDSPAHEGGILPGDVILRIEGAPAPGLKEAVQQIKGPVGTAVRLTIGRGDGQEIEVSLTRRPIKLATIKGHDRRPDQRWSYLLDPARRIGYVLVQHFAKTTADELREAVTSSGPTGLRGMILDLRSCPGGLLESAAAVANLFLREGAIVSLHGRTGELKTIAADGTGPLADLPLVILVNGETSSAAEIVAGALQDHRRAVVVGTRTHGKGSVQTLIKLEEGNGAIKLTTAHYRLPGGRDIDRKVGGKSWGVDPDEGFFVPVDGQADPQLPAAIETLTARLAGGRFTPVSDVGAPEIEAFLKREELRRRRTSLEDDLKRITRELAELDREAPAAK